MNHKLANSKKVIVFLVDGMRPDGLESAQTPFLDQVPLRGAFTYNARSVMPTTTLPCITSLFFSCPPKVHGITGNEWTSLARPIPSLFDFIHQQNLPVASFYNWEPLRDLSRPGSLAVSYFLEDVLDDEGQVDRELSTLAAAWLQSHEWAFSFVYLQNTDKVGHLHGWMSPQYLGAISNADRCIRQVCSVIPEETIVIITSDHGGHEKTHHSDMKEDITIPLMIYGPGIVGGHELAGEVSIIDIAPTATALLGLETPQSWMGRNLAL